MAFSGGEAGSTNLVFVCPGCFSLIGVFFGGAFPASDVLAPPFGVTDMPDADEELGRSPGGWSTFALEDSL